VEKLLELLAAGTTIEEVLAHYRRGAALTGRPVRAKIVP
jgi:uncharacterized protein (DUF433 family)